MSRVVNVSNRVPASGGIHSGGLAVGVLAAMRVGGGLWFGWNGETIPDEPGQPQIVIRDGIAFATIPLPQALYEAYYGGSERRQRHEKLLNVVRENDVHKWHTRFVEQLGGQRQSTLVGALHPVGSELPGVDAELSRSAARA